MPAPTSSDASSPTTADVVAYNRAVGARVREARQLAGLNQADLCRAVGIGRDVLTRVESGTDIEGGAAPWMLQRIAVVCCVKADFLLGLTEESEPDEPGPTWKEMAWLSHQRACRERERHVEDLVVRDAHLAEFRELAAEVDAGIDAVQIALERVAELNPDEWEDLRAGARLVSTIDSLRSSVGVLSRRSSVYVDRQVIDAAPETLLDLEIAAA
ncbi:hypothetical protein FIU88_19090 (plasmid) [Halomonas sp. THAF12]|uniref:helix-turn-helix domain-containing protein n=1 Tax=Halomonas sp. THAF12 TaxID=2587849 RepID=UPI0012680C7D|nr:helix-turn-helix transcriptional regulator [Halomonas sp. THAF12]QFT86818.1 hypothetical protein FIU88_17875 [Halomonas sp. THAF12]QFT87061.1 hypothetical protein FIU88_19090 [Halomonas sp. THAF12]